MQEKFFLCASTEISRTNQLIFFDEANCVAKIREYANNSGERKTSAKSLWRLWWGTRWSVLFAADSCLVLFFLQWRGGTTDCCGWFGAITSLEHKQNLGRVTSHWLLNCHSIDAINQFNLFPRIDKSCWFAFFLAYKSQSVSAITSFLPNVCLTLAPVCLYRCQIVIIFIPDYHVPGNLPKWEYTLHPSVRIKTQVITIQLTKSLPESTTTSASCTRSWNELNKCEIFSRISGAPAEGHTLIRTIVAVLCTSIHLLLFL